MIVSHLLLTLHKKIQFYICMFEAWNVAKGRKVQGAEYFRKALSQTTFCTSTVMKQWRNTKVGCFYIKVYVNNMNTLIKQ